MLDEDEVSRLGRLGRDLWVAWENVREGWENLHLQRDVRHRDGKDSRQHLGGHYWRLHRKFIRSIPRLYL